MHFRAGFKLFVIAIVATWLSGCGGTSTTTRPTTPPKSSGDTSQNGDAQPDTADVVAQEDEPVEGGWGTLRGQFIFDGTPPAPEKVDLNKDKEFCEKHAPFKEMLVVNQENKGIANVVVSLVTKDKKPEIHESYQATADGEVTLDNSGCRFDPHVVVLRTSQTLRVKNSDDVLHNTLLKASANEQFNQSLPGKTDLTKQLEKAERRPVSVECSIHPWMKGWVIVRDDPYVAVSDKDGNFEIKNLPTGKWTFHVWQEEAGHVREAKVGGKKENWKLGRFELVVKPDDNDLGQIMLSEAIFKN